MSQDFRGHPLFPPGFNSPTRFEGDVYDCEVWGKIPTDITGTFYRMQCDFDYRPPMNEWMTGFNGDGHISRFRFANGSVDYKGRYVRTARLMAERAARKRLFGVYRNRFTDDPSVAKINRSAANTHTYWHGGKLFALKEDSLPYTLDPHTLETLGDWNFNGKYTATTMSAHPKIDPMTGEMIAYGYQAKGDLTRDIAVYTINPQGEVTREVWLTSPYLGIIHDIAITQKHVLIPVIARTTSLERLKSGEPMWEWDGNLPTMVGVLPRDGQAKDVRWYKGPARNTLHFLNATDRGSKVTMELPTSSGERDPSQIRRWTFDLKSKKDTFAEEVVSTTPGILPRMDDRYLSLDYRYAYVSSRDPNIAGDPKRVPTGAARFMSNVLQRLDVHTGEIKQCAVEPVQSLQEACFVPRQNSKGEGDGYVMCIASNFESTSSDLVIADAQHLEDGVIATVKLPFRLRSGTHTNWYPQSALPPIKDELT
ncbi:MAG TPA: carotenoid oxygenase family protein [Steroidobacteraceae bacterium]|nr:carotenoid oxygenase family protein [Steroidobacteraceae bacterium]